MNNSIDLFKAIEIPIYLALFLLILRLKITLTILSCLSFTTLDFFNLKKMVVIIKYKTNINYSEAFLFNLKLKIKERKKLGLYEYLNCFKLS